MFNQKALSLEEQECKTLQVQKQAGQLARRRWYPFLIVTVVLLMSFLVVIETGFFAPTRRAHAQGSGILNAVVYDITHNRYYSYYPSGAFIAASSMKVPIMLTFLDMIEQQDRRPTRYEMGLLTTMIENSNNNSASALYYGEIGGAAGVTRYFHKIGIIGLYLNPHAWGYSLIYPATMVRMLTRLYQGSILTLQDRNLALYLMEHVEVDQRVGVGDTAPRGATVALKDGWVIGPDGLWVMNSSGIVTLGRETYVIAAYTRDDSSLATGQNIVRRICAQVAAQLR